MVPTYPTLGVCFHPVTAECGSCTACSSAGSPAATCQVLGKKPPFHFIEAGLLHDPLGPLESSLKTSEARLCSLRRAGAAMLNYESALPPLAH